MRRTVQSPLGKLRSIAVSTLAPLVVLCALASCGDEPPVVPPPGFDDHTVLSLSDRADYFALAAEGIGGRSVTKFLITAFSDSTSRSIRYSDSAFYRLHDEWYWFRLLNGQPIPGDQGVEPVEGLRFDSIEQIYVWARQQTSFPLDLRFLGERFYSPRFYNVALSRPRLLGLGSLLFVPERTEAPVRPELWLFELEYQDAPEHAELVVFFESLMTTLPAEIGASVKWVVRSPAQETLAQQMEAAELPYHDRILRYGELAVPGEVEVYSSGLTAGRVKLFRAGDPALQSTGSGDIVITEDVPDFLPPASALITAVPQTPLAHINVLAKNRGIPNLYVGGIAEDPEIDQISRGFGFAIVRAVEPDEFRLKPITNAEYNRWKALKGTTSSAAVPQIDLASAPYHLPLADLSFADVEALRPLIGGKSAGFLGLLASGLETPPDPMAITVRAYAEHIAPLLPTIRDMLSDGSFGARAPIRTLLLEGPSSFDARFPSPDDQALKNAFLSGHPEGNRLGDLVRGGGLRGVIRDRPMNPATSSRLVAELRTQFADLDPAQGLRFRSSSTVEDIEGFNGAGLYDSNTGFFEPTQQPDTNDHKKTIEWAIKKTWASYWASEAFDERAHEQIDHLSGNMAVLVHPRFDDPLEQSNGVFTYTRLPSNHEDRGVLVLNVQKGSLSVANPETTDLPEVDRVTEDTLGQLIIERVRPSTLADPGEQLFTDTMLRALFDDAKRTTDLWLAQSNSGVAAVHASETLTLDFEVKHMAAGWPKLASSQVLPARVVIKQARSLEPGLRKLPRALRREPFPHDILGRARRVERVECMADAFVLTSTQATTDPLLSPDMGYSETPFAATVSVRVLVDIPEIGLMRGEVISLDHLDLLGVERGEDWSLWADLTPEASASAGFDRIEIDSDGMYRLQSGASSALGNVGECARSVVFSTPSDYLESLLSQD